MGSISDLASEDIFAGQRLPQRHGGGRSAQAALEVEQHERVVRPLGQFGLNKAESPVLRSAHHFLGQPAPALNGSFFLP